MGDLEFCKQQLQDIAEFATVGLFQFEVTGAVRKFMKLRFPEARDRAALKAWATSELSKLECVPGSGTSKIVLDSGLGETGRRMSMLQLVLKEIEAAEVRAFSKPA